MKNHNFARWTARIILLAFLLLSCLMFTSCKSKKKALYKKSEKVSELSQQDITTSQHIKADVTTFRISESDHFSVSPIDNEKPVQVINGQDTLNFKNAKVDFGSSREQEQIRDKSETTKDSREKKLEEKETKTKEKELDKESTGTSPALIWGSIAAGLVILGFLYFKKLLPFL